MTAARRLANVTGSAYPRPDPPAGVDEDDVSVRWGLAPLYDMYKKGEKNSFGTGDAFDTRRIETRRKPAVSFYIEQRSLNIMISISKLRGLSHF